MNLIQAVYEGAGITYVLTGGLVAVWPARCQPTLVRFILWNKPQFDATRANLPFVRRAGYRFVAFGMVILTLSQWLF